MVIAGKGISMTISQNASKEEFKRLAELPAFQDALKFPMTNGDRKKFDPQKMPSTERIDAINTAVKGALRTNK